MTDGTRLSGGRRSPRGSKSELSGPPEVGPQTSLLAGGTYFSCEISCINPMFCVRCISRKPGVGIFRTFFLSKDHVEEFVSRIYSVSG